MANWFANYIHWSIRLYYQVVVQAMIIALWSCFSFWPTAAVAHPVGKKDRVLLTFSAGPAWYHAGETQTFNVQTSF